MRVVLVGLLLMWTVAATSAEARSMPLPPASLPGDNRSGYAIAVLTRGQPTFESGIETTVGIAARVNTAMHFGSAI
jgi:hypothetical protein